MPDRIVRERGRRIVRTRVLGSSNPVARWGRESKATCMDSFGGFFLGILLFCITFALPYCAATQEKDSKDIAKLEVRDVAAGVPSDGKALISGPLTATNTPVPPLDSRTGAQKAGTTIIYYQYTMDLWQTHTETHTETRTVTENGQDIEITEEVTEDVSEWVNQRDERRWAQLSVGTVIVNPERCDIDLPEIEIYRQELPNQRREVVTAILLPDQVLLAAELQSGQVAPEPDFYRLTTKSKDELVASLNSAEESSRWIKIVLSVILWTVALNLIVGPAMVIFNIFPIKAVGCGLRALVGLVSFLTALALTFTMYVAIRYWWAVVLALILLTWLLVTVVKKGKAEPDLSVPEDTA
ncbi:hypothetical protein IT575_08680 [bacterium]|nr:hypothetical protein [bacterium]